MIRKAIAIMQVEGKKGAIRGISAQLLASILPT
jgi:hypothetical protein